MPTNPIGRPPNLLEEVHEMVQRLVSLVDGHDDGKNAPRPGLKADVADISKRVTRLERIVAGAVASSLTIATLVSGAWVLQFLGPHNPVGR